jgi:hypothetical protein
MGNGQINDFPYRDESETINIAIQCLHMHEYQLPLKNANSKFPKRKIKKH